jgi:hypothetical protein
MTASRLTIRTWFHCLKVLNVYKFSFLDSQFFLSLNLLHLCCFRVMMTCFSVVWNYLYCKPRCYEHLEFAVKFYCYYSFAWIDFKCIVSRLNLKFESGWGTCDPEHLTIFDNSWISASILCFNCCWLCNSRVF